MNIGNWLHRTAQRTPLKPAFFLGTDCVASYGEFHARASSVARWLQSQGVQSGDRVGIFMGNVPEYLIVQYAAWYCGAAVVPINAKLHAKEVAWILKDAGAKLCFTSEAKTAQLQKLDTSAALVPIPSADFETALSLAGSVEIEQRGADDLAWLFYTSGTTGRPKGVVITHGMLTSVSLAYFADVDQVRPEDAALYAAPLSHGAGLYNMLHVLKGARHIFPVSGGFDEAEILDLAEHHGSVHMFAAPTMVKRLTDRGRRDGRGGTGLRTIVYAGGPMYLADIVDAVDHFGDIFVQIYGQGECPMGITALCRDDVADRTHTNWQSRLASVGRAQSHCEVKIGTPDGAAAAVGAVGEIMVRGAAVMPGYWQNTKATAETIVDGWLRTGDMGFMDADGYVTLQDRSKDMIISGGSNIYPREVEEILLSHPDVDEVSVVGRSHPEWGEEVVAFVVAAPGRPVVPAVLDALCLDQIARFKRPKDYIELDQLPKNNYGKVLKTALRDLLK